MSSINSAIKGLQLGLQPALAWTAILGFVFFSILCILAGAGSILRLAFPAGAFLVAVFLYLRYPILYVSFTWWLWFLTPWVRRLIDVRVGFAEPNLVLLAPFLATMVTIVTLLRHLPKAYRQDSLPFILSFVAVCYGFLIGVINSRYGFESSASIDAISSGKGLVVTLNSVMIRTLDWISPVLFGFHLFANWQHYPEYRQNIQRTFRWGVLVMAIYGIVQYLIAPEWDRFWLINVIKTGNTAFGSPEPLGIRVFSTMNSPGPFAIMLMAGLLVLFSDQGVVRLIAATSGYFTFLLTLVRSAWGGWIVGLAIFMTSLKTKLQVRLIITILVLGVCVFPLTTIEPFSEVINARLETLTNIKEDGSYQARSAVYERGLNAALTAPLGNGLGVPGVDSGIIDIFIALGWLGVIPYLGGLLLLLFKQIQSLERRFDPFLNSALAISIAVFTQLIFTNILIGVQGVVGWGFLGISLAGTKYYQHQRLSRTQIKHEAFNR